MSFSIGNHIKTAEGNKQIEVHYVDPLAPFYNDIKNRHQGRLPDIEFGMMEYLSESYPSHNVAWVIYKNALDHSFNPIKGVLEALEVLKIGGYLYLKHYPNEAETEHYVGFHKYNICTNEKGELLIWNKEKSLVVDEMVKDFAEVDTKLTKDGSVVSVIKKSGDLPSGLIDAKRNKREFFTILLGKSSNFISMRFILIMKIKYMYYDIVQYFVQSLSKDSKRKLRHFLKSDRLSR